MTFYEIQAKSIINRVPGASRMPFEYTINPYRGCSHACVYCFARNTHTYLDLDAGHDFDSKVVVKVNAPRAAAPGAGRAEVGRRAHRHGHQCGLLPAGRGPLRADARHHRRAARRANPFSILTKGTLITRDLDLLQPGGRGHPGRGQLLGRLRGRDGVARASSRARRVRGGGWTRCAASPTPASPCTC